MLPCVAVAFRPAQRSVCSSLRSFATTTSRSARPTKARPPRSRGNIPAPSNTERVGLHAAKGVGASNPTLASVQQHRAKQLYDAGVRQVYEARGSSKVIASYAIGACFIGYAVNLLTLRHWDSDTLTGMGSWQKMFVAGVNKVGMFACSLVGGLIILRYSGFIRSIRLVDAGHETIKLDIHMRRRLPWSKTHYTVEPGALVMPRQWRQRIIPDVETESSRNLVALLGKPYVWLKSWILMDGVVAPVRLSSDAAGQLDTRGTFNISMSEFSALTSQPQAQR